MPFRISAVCIGLLCCLGLADRASAELVFFTTGRHLSVKSHRVEADRVVLQLRNGGEIICEASIIRSIEPDEVPWPEPPVAVSPEMLATTATSLVTPYDDIIERVSAEQGVDAILVKAMMQVESAYKPRARSHKGAMGLMQLMPETARQYSVTNPYDPQSNIEGGVKHLKSLLARFELSLALAAYNAGEAAVKRFNGIPPYRETRDYVSRILRLVGRS